MLYKKITAKQVFDGYRFVEKTVLVVDEKGIIADMIPLEAAGDHVQELEGILCPGFINVHCHLELSHLKGKIDQKTGLRQFVQQVVAQRNAPPAVIAEAIAAADQEMYANGIVAVGDICNTTDAFITKQESPLYYHHFVEAYNFDAGKVAQDFAKYQAVFERYLQQSPRKTSLVPHAPYSVSTALWEHLTRAAKDTIISIHNQETADENNWFLNGTGGFKTMYENMGISLNNIPSTGKTSLQSYYKQLQQTKNILVHNVYTSEADISFARSVNPDVYWCLCVSANKYISDMVPPADLFIAQQQNIVLGTDSLASNKQLSIWKEIQTIRKHFPEIELTTLLQWATSNGARALNIDQHYGSFEKGKQPGIVQVVNNEAKRVVL